ncbi:MAG TPA: sigma-70 family RNA polymerase sigma factor [Pyrinomonadaceae bacterium]|jgi:RNA polymerase sigma-70 factor (ECF subfamily)
MSDNRTDVNDATFVARFNSGDESAFYELFVQVYPQLCGYLMKHFELDFRDVEDIALEAMTNVSQNMGKFKPGKAKLRTWIFQIGINKAKDFLRLRMRVRDRDALDDPGIIDSFEDFAEQENPGLELVQFDQILESEDVSTPDKVLAREIYSSLNKDEQDILLWRAILGMTFEEISKSTGVPANTLKVRYKRAKDKFERLFKEKISERRRNS